MGREQTGAIGGACLRKSTQCASSQRELLRLGLCGDGPVGGLTAEKHADRPTGTLR